MMEERERQVDMMKSERDRQVDMMEDRDRDRYT